MLMAISTHHRTAHAVGEGTPPLSCHCRNKRSQEKGKIRVRVGSAYTLSRNGEMGGGYLSLSLSVQLPTGGPRQCCRHCMERLGERKSKDISECGLCSQANPWVRQPQDHCKSSPHHDCWQEFPPLVGRPSFKPHQLRQKHFVSYLNQKNLFLGQ